MKSIPMFKDYAPVRLIDRRPGQLGSSAVTGAGWKQQLQSSAGMGVLDTATTLANATRIAEIEVRFISRI